METIWNIATEEIIFLQEILDASLEDYPDLRVFEVEEAICKTGNKQFSLPLCKPLGNGWKIQREENLVQTIDFFNKQPL